jgi:hypothetical protein
MAARAWAPPPTAHPARAAASERGTLRASMDREEGSTRTAFDPRDPASVQVRLQILNAEHQSLLAARSLAWNESFARAGMYLSILSASIVALGLIAGIDKLGDVFVTFAIVILPVVLFVGIATLTRMGIANYHEALTVWGMNRIRGGYLEIAPDLEPYFVMGTHDDTAGMRVTMAMPQSLPAALNVISATPFLVTILNGVVAGAIVGIVLLHWLGAGVPLTVLASGATFLVAVIAQGWVAAWSIGRSRGAIRPLFPTPGAASSGTAGPDEEDGLHEA